MIGSRTFSMLLLMMKAIRELLNEGNEEIYDMPKPRGGHL